MAFECFADYVLRHTNGQSWIVMNLPSIKYPDKFRFTEAQFGALKTKYSEDNGFSPYSPEYLAADNADWAARGD